MTDGSEVSMITAEATTPLGPGDRAPDITVPAITHEGVISLGEYRGRRPLLLALFRGLY
jgi:peroxiredoxin